MKRNSRTTPLGLAAMCAVVMASLLSVSEPVQAQAPPTPIQCNLPLTTPQAWDTQNWSTRSFTCDTVEVQTRAHLVWPCIPGPSCIPWVYFESRARRTTIPNIVLARAQAIPGPVCVHQPATTAWTAWASCNIGAAHGAPTGLNLIGVRLP